MTDNLGNFLVDLASEPDRLARFLANPMPVLDASSLTPDEQRMVRFPDSGDLEDAIRTRKTNGTLTGGGPDERQLPAKKKKKTVKKKKKAPAKKAPARKKTPGRRKK
ncbi:MAG TPA: hypothetical protein VNG89_26570 [Vicinamibacterales bacterium]|nr:hypothetical protein [Vicinamibacterales bacterium]